MSMEEIDNNSFTLGSCQYDDIADTVGEHYLKVLELKDVEAFIDYIKTNFDIDIIYNEIDQDTIYDSIKVCLIESLVDIHDLDLLVSMSDESYDEKDIATEILNLYKIGKLDQNIQDFIAKNPDCDKEELKVVMEVIYDILKATTISELIISCMDSCWDLWGCVRTFSGFAGISYGELEDSRLDILFLIWKFKIENPFEVFYGFST